MNHSDCVQKMNHWVATSLTVRVKKICAMNHSDGGEKMSNWVNDLPVLQVRTQKNLNC